MTLPTVKEILKKSSIIRSFGKNFRRIVLHSKYIYFIRSTPFPLSNQYGFDRGTPLDRYFIEDFLEQHKKDISGRCLEIHDNAYTIRFGGDNVYQSDVLDIEENNKNATIIEDLRNAQSIEDETYDCIILTQVFQFIDDLDAAVSECKRILAPNGVLLVTLPAISRTDCISGPSGDYWRFTTAGARYLFEKVFSPNALTIKSYGNARTGQYFLAGLSIEDTPRGGLLHTHDEHFPTIITLKATKHA